MPKVGSGNEALYERALFVYTGSLWVPLKADASGQLAVGVIAGQSIEVTQTTPADLQATVTPAAGASFTVAQATPASLQAAVNLNADQNVQARAYGYVGGAWQRQPIARGFTACKGQNVTNTDLAAGTNVLDLAAVAAGTVFVVTNITMYYAGTITNVTLQASAVVGGVAYPLWFVKPVVSGVIYDRQGTWYLNAGDAIRFTVVGATLHDDFVGDVVGYTFATNL
jgi:hypothetical protein